MNKINVQIKTKNIELTNDIKSYVEEKIGLLEKFIPKSKMIPLAEFEVGKENEHHANGEDLYRAEINLSLGKKMLRTVSLKGDIFTAIDDAKDQMQIRVTSNTRKAVDLIRKGARKAKDMLRFRGSSK